MRLLDRRSRKEINLKILTIPDTHFPFEHAKAMSWAIKLAHAVDPDHIVQIGDLLDQFSFSRYPRARKMDPDEELKLGRSRANAMWKSMPKRAKKHQLMGNHDDRMLKMALKAAPELMGIIEDSLEDLYRFEGVKTVTEYEYELEGLMFQHGHRAKLGDHAKYNQCSTVVGHSHRGGVVFYRNRSGMYWELNSGFLGDISTAAFTYVAQKKVNTTTLGVGYIDDLGPRFIPYVGP